MQPVYSEYYRYPKQGSRLMKSFQQQAARVVQGYEVRYLTGLEIRTRYYGTRCRENRWVISVDSVRIFCGASGKPEKIQNPHIRFVLSDRNGNARLETSDDAQIMSREDYYPFGGTATWLTRCQSCADYKTHRYAGHERDRTGFIYYGWRYFLPWLMRWLNPDPAGTVDGINLFRMVKNNPATLRDINGCMTMPSVENKGPENSSSYMDNAGRFPFRFKGEPLLLKGFNVKRINCDAIAPRNAFDQVRPFIDPATSDEDRRQLYARNVRIETFKESDVSMQGNRKMAEKRLVGQEKLVAARDIAKGTCIGIYGGDIYTKEEYQKFDGEKQANLLVIDDVSDKIAVDGNNPMAKMNTIFELNAAGNNLIQAEDGYNVSKFIGVAHLKNDSPLRSKMIEFDFLYFMTSRDIKSGEELRWNYDYSSKTINNMLFKNAVRTPQSRAGIPSQAVRETQNQSYAFSLAVLGVGLVIALALWMAYA